MKKTQKLSAALGFLLAVITISSMIMLNAQAAGEAIIAINPVNNSAVTGIDFSVEVVIDPLAHYVSNVDLYLTYDQTKFTLTSITNSSAFSTVLNQSIPAPANGTASYSASTTFGTHISAVTTFATLNFHAVATANNSPITITGSTMVYADNSPTYPADAGNNVVGTRTSGAVTVTVADTTAPTFTVNDGTSATYIKNDTINVTVADATGVASQFYGFSADNICNASDTIATAFPSATNFTIVGNHADYLCLKATDSSTNANVSYQLVGQLHTDNTVPIGGSVDYTDGFLATKSFAIVASDGTDNVGINTGSRTVQRRSATPSGGVCGSFGSWTTITPSGTYPNLSDTSIAEHTCYQYQFMIADAAGNQATYASAHIIKSSYRADINNNGSVLGDDFSILHNNYDAINDRPGDIADITGDNKVNGADFSILHNEYGNTF